MQWLTRRKLTCLKRRAEEEKPKADPRRPSPSVCKTRAGEGERALEKTNQQVGTWFAQGSICDVPSVFSARFHQIHAESVELHVLVFFLVFLGDGKR